MPNQKICLKWNSFQANILTSFESLWEEEGFVDVTLASDGQCIRAHKVILSACSPFFKRIFESNPCQHPVIILQDVHFSEIESLLNFVYKGEVHIDEDNLPALLRAAETLQIRGLSGASDQLKQKTTVQKKCFVQPPDESSADGSPPLKRLRHTQRPPRSPIPIPASPVSSPTSLPPPRPLQLTSAENVSPTLRQPYELTFPTKEEFLENESCSPEPPLEENFDESNDDSMDLMAKHMAMKTEQMNVLQNFPYPPFPCPFCDRAYTSWGFRRRHMKAVHSHSPRLPCKWCLLVLSSHEEWEQHVITDHSLSPDDARNGLLILEEAHMVLQIPNPTRLDAFVQAIKQSSNRDGGGGSGSGGVADTEKESKM